ncbi:MAG: SDR family NAD(P)-dependent oxidoreductase [Pseudomonadota bacterium]
MAADPSAASRVVWITGASSGIGRALALNLAKSGNRVAASARRAGALEELSAEIEGPGAIAPFPLDVTDHGAAARTFEQIERSLGEIDVAVLSAGTHLPRAEGFQAKDLSGLIDINVMGVANCLEPLIASMVARGRGRIAIVSSVAGYRGLPTASYYGATKAALINLAEALHMDLGRHGVTVQVVNPGFVKTPLTDKNTFTMPFLISAEEAAEHMARGLNSSRFEIAFPLRFVLILKLLRCLPYRLYFPLVSRATGK